MEATLKMSCAKNGFKLKWIANNIFVTEQQLLPVSRVNVVHPSFVHDITWLATLQMVTGAEKITRDSAVKSCLSLR